MASGGTGGKSKQHFKPSQQNQVRSFPYILTVITFYRRGRRARAIRQHARGRSSPPPSGGSSGLARASPALFAEKVLTHHKHHRKSTPPLRKRPLAQKALRALWPWLGHAGSTKFGRPQKTQAFFGAPELRPHASVMRNGARRRGCLIPTIPVRGSAGWARTAAK